MKIAIDFDKTIYDAQKGELLPNAYETIERLYRNNNQLILWTCRTGKDFEKAVEILEHFNILRFFEDIQNLGNYKKIPVDMFIDDKNIGGFPGWEYVENQVIKAKGGEYMKIEIRSKNEMIVSGYVNAVERDSRVLADIRHGKFVEKVKAKTFERALARNPCIELRFNHGKVIGDTKTNLQLYEDSIGLFAKATITDTEVISKAKELRGWSFGFTDNKPSWDDSGEVSKRTLEDISLKEVSILTKTPAYIGTSVEVRDDEVLITETRGTEDNVTDFSEHKNYKQTFEFYKLKGSTIL